MTKQLIKQDLANVQNWLKNNVHQMTLKEVCEAFEEETVIRAGVGINNYDDLGNYSIIFTIRDIYNTKDDACVDITFTCIDAKTLKYLITSIELLTKHDIIEKYRKEISNERHFRNTKILELQVQELYNLIEDNKNK